MIKFNKYVFFTSGIFLLLSCQYLFALPAADSGGEEDTLMTRSLQVSFDYGTNRTFQGRTAGVDQVFLAPSISYEAPTGFFGSLLAYRLLSPKSRWEELDLNFGWGFYLFHKKLEASVAYTRFASGKQSQQLNSAFKNNLETVLRKYFGPVKTKIYFDYDFGDGNNDYGFTLDNSHDFVIENILMDEDELKIKPLVSITAGTLNFYKVHLKKQDQKPTLQNPDLAVTTQFNLTGIELSLPVEYNIGRFSLEPAIHRSIPLNQPKRLNVTPVTYFTMSLSFSII